MAVTDQQNLKNDTEELKADLEAIRKDIKQLFGDLKKVTKSEAESAGRKAGEMKDAAIDAARERRDDVEDYVKEHPLGALAAAAGVGFVLALLLGRH